MSDGPTITPGSGEEPSRPSLAASTNPVPTPRSRPPIPRWLQAIGLVTLCAILFLTGLGDRGLAYSEGHRVGPAWEMLDSGTPWAAPDAWLLPHLFEAPYLRKPPGTPWAVALSSALLGRTEFAARLPAALAITLLTLLTWRLTTRWLGTPWGLAAGLAQALFPVFWSSARSAEIEMLHAAATGAAALLLADAMLRTEPRRWLPALGAGLGLTAMALTKGPAGLPVVAAIPIGVCLASRSLAPLARPALALAVLVPAVLLGLAFYATSAAVARLDTSPITQGLGEFLWEPSKILRILSLPFVAWGHMLPASLALLLILWRPPRHDAPPADTPRARADLIARALGLAWLLAIAAYTIIGVSNPRYTLPAATLLPPIAAMAIAGLRTRPEHGGFTPARRGLARLLSLRGTAAWPIILAIGFVAFLARYEHPRGLTSGDTAGAALAAILQPAAERHATIWADELVECRPEVLLYARSWTPSLHIRWAKPLDTAPARPGDILIVRTDRHALPDNAPTEAQRCEPRLAEATMLHRFEVHKYAFMVYELPAAPIP